MSTGPAAGSARLLRAAGLAGLVTALAAGGHVVGGGRAPSALALGVLAALVLPVAVLVSGRRVRAVPAGLLLAAGQAAAHAIFSATHCAGAAVVASAAHVHGAAGLDLACEPTGPHAPVTLAMVAGHAAATVVTAVAVAHVERALWWLLDLLAPLTRELVVPTLTRPDLRRRTPAPRALVALHLRDHPSRRGPPRGVLRLVAHVPVPVVG